MSSQLKYHPEAAAEATEAVRWYLEQSLDAAIRFFEEMQRVEKKVQSFPDRWSPHLHGTCLYRFKRFPYGLIYQQRQGYILVVAVAHLKRKPGYWKNRMAKSNQDSGET